MNEKQKTYNSYDYMTKMIKVSESLYHIKNLWLIKTRKSPYMETSSSSVGVFKRKEDPVNEYFKTKNDKYMSNRIVTISNKPPKPILNTEFIANDKKKKEFNLKMKKVKRQALQRENEDMAKRIDNLHSFISTKELDKNFNCEHQKLVKKLLKVPNGKLLLPHITLRNYQHHRSHTETAEELNTIKLNHQTIS